ncbi:hypothetical protein ACFL2O_08555 [Thermodesulfobacteriota bacterium]
MKRILTSAIFTVFIFAISLSTAPSWAADGGEKNIPIHYPGQVYKIDFLQPDHYPERFDGIGKLDELREDAVIIEDTEMDLAPNVTFRGLKKGSRSKKLFVPGQRVGYIVDENAVVVSLWLLVEAPED